MEFWGVEVPSGKPLTCKPGADSYVHVSQAALGDNKSAKGNDRVVLKVKVGSNEVIVGTLSQGKCDQTTLDLIFEKDFVLSHNSPGSVFFCGYKTDAVKDDVSGSSDEDDDEFDASEDDFEENAPELVQLAAKENGKLGLKAGKSEALANRPPAKSLASKVEVPVVESKPKAKAAVIEEVSKGDKSDDDDDDEDEDEDDDEDDDMLGSGSDEEDMDSDEEGDSDDEDESEEEQPKSAGKKRPLPTGKPGLPGKKSKIAGKPDPKLPSVPASTPKQQPSAKKDSGKKTPGKENAATPASGKKLGQHFCEPCKKNFNSETALNQHKTAKHK